ncbi:complex I 24 kDa subunit family protein [Sporosalibacterium faouarense]|uniref:NADH-quinone oxidoreductase subunit NuoE family protein n=1 Tax=Sporosalibacterium faouarense TaxID=516123 RepID=UPI00192C9FC4|nr:NAD(P)H-dependent oxidoreductase subunit E [Sporosalibacterium faouarense]
MGFKFDWEENKEKIETLKEVIEENRSKKGSLMPVLHRAQKIFGYLPIEVQSIISEELNVPLAEIYGVATFYSQFSLIPKGKYQIGVCLGTACYVKGSQSLVDKVKKELNLEVDGTTADGKFSLQATRCIGACGLAPVMTVNEDVYGKLKSDEIPKILKKYMD